MPTNDLDKRCRQIAGDALNPEPVRPLGPSAQGRRAVASAHQVDEREAGRLRANAQRQRSEEAYAALGRGVDAMAQQRLGRMDADPVRTAHTDLLLLIRYADPATLQLAVDRLADLIQEVREHARRAQERQQTDATRWMSNW